MSPLSKKRGHHDLRILGFDRIASTAAVRTRGDFGSIPSQCQGNFVFSDKGPPFFIANQQILRLTVSTGYILIFHSLPVVVENGTNTSQ